MSTSGRLTLVVLADVPADGVDAFQRYEAAVLPLLRRHDGRVERRLRTADGQAEVQIVSFGSRSACRGYLADPERTSHRSLLHGVAVAQRVLEMSDVDAAPPPRGASGGSVPGSAWVAVDVTTRPLTESDGPILRTATLTNVNWTGEDRFTYRDVDQAPDLRRYCELRSARGDFGFVAERHGLPVGVVWALFLGGEDRGYGFVEEGVPELSICVWSGYRGQGVGGELLRRVLGEARARGLERVSLSVEAANPAQRLYRTFGFRPVPDAPDGTLAVDL